MKVHTGTDRRGIQSFSASEDLVDQLQRRTMPTQEQARGVCRGGGLLAAGDFVAHQP